MSGETGLQPPDSEGVAKAQVNRSHHRHSVYITHLFLPFTRLSSIFYGYLRAADEGVANGTQSNGASSCDLYISCIQLNSPEKCAII